jgi:integrase/recombinase XerD
MLNKLVNSYLRRLKAKNYSPKTLYPRKFSLQKFQRFLAEKGIKSPKQFKKNLLERYQEWLSETPSTYSGKVISVVSQNTDLKAARKFCDYLSLEEVISINPTAHSTYAREPQRLVQALTSYEIKRLLEAPDKTTALGYRDRTMMELAYVTGMRRGEVSNLKLEDVDLGNKLVYVRQSKFLKDRPCVLGKISVVYLTNYLSKVRPMMLKDPSDPYVFLSQQGRKLAEQGLYRLMDKYGKQMGMRRKVCAHIWRSTCLTECARNGMHPMHLQAMAGHSTMDSLTPYLAHDVEDQRKALKTFHPRERGEL